MDMKVSKILRCALSVVLAVSMLVCSSLLLTSFAAAPQYDSNFQEHENWVESTVSDISKKYTNRDKFIVFYYRPDTCYNSYSVATYSLVPWMDCGTKIYGLNADTTSGQSRPAWLNNLLDGTTLPYVIFIDNQNISIYRAGDYDSMTEMVSALNGKYASFSGNVIDTSALSSSEIRFDVTYHQTEARTILSKINSLRTGNNAWYWKADNSGKENCSGLEALEYDYYLEKAAMQRAAELAVYFAHTRPNGESCFTAYQAGYAGENIAYGQSTASVVQTTWEEANAKYEGQGHRRNMLSSGYKAVGVGCAEYDGVKFWVQEFSNTVRSTSQTQANDETSTVTVTVLDKLVESKSVSSSYAAVALNAGDVVALPDAGEKTVMAVKPKKSFFTKQNCSWTSEDPEIATVSSGTIKAVKGGDAVLTGKCAAGTVKVNVSVSGSPSTGDTFTLTYDANGGSGGPAKQTGSGNTVIPSSVPEKSNCTFKGWAETQDASSAKYQPGDTVVLNKDLTLYAVWQNNDDPAVTKYTLTYDANGGTGAPAKQTGQGNVRISGTVPTRTGYTFLGWAEKPDATESQYSKGSLITLDKDITLYAVWMKNNTPDNPDNPVPAELPKADIIKGNPSGKQKEYDYKSTVIFTADVPEGGSAQWYVDGKEAGNGSTLMVSDRTSDYTVTVVVTDKNGRQTVDEENVTIRNGLFDKIIWFFVHLFNPNAYTVWQ